MQNNHLSSKLHSHTFDQDRKLPGETRTLIVIAVTSIMMVAEIAAGILFGSMALLADGLHMASHTAALSINVFAYIYARRHAHDNRYSFGTGKVNALGGFTGAVLLALFSILMVWESGNRFIHPVAIAFNQAVIVAVLGFLVNGASVFILKHQSDHPSEDRYRGEPHTDPPAEQNDSDHNLRSAYLHVLADALTSLLAIFALLTAKYLGLIWMDPFMGIVGAILVARWSVGLMRTAGAVLLDKQGPAEIQLRIKENIESDGDHRVADLHLWFIGPNIYAAIVTVVTFDPKPPSHYKRLIPTDINLVHVTVEVQPQEKPAAGAETLRTGSSENARDGEGV